MKNSTKITASKIFNEVGPTNSLIESFNVNDQSLALKSASEKTGNCLSTSEISFLKVLIGLNIQRA